MLVYQNTEVQNNLNMHSKTYFCIGAKNDAWISAWKAFYCKKPKLSISKCFSIIEFLCVSIQC